MVKVNGPMFSLAASGTLADAITFSTWKGRPYVRERVIPSNPKSGAQLGRRAMFAFLTQSWSAIDAAPQATWQDLADQLVASKFNAYISANMENWHNFLTPMQGADGDRGDNGSDNVLTSADYEENRIKLSIAGSSLAEAWGIAIFAKLAGAADVTVAECIIVEADTTIAAHTTFWTPPSLGRWYFDSITFSADGAQETAGGPQDTGA